MLCIAAARPAHPWLWHPFAFTRVHPQPLKSFVHSATRARGNVTKTCASNYCFHMRALCSLRARTSTCIVTANLPARITPCQTALPAPRTIWSHSCTTTPQSIYSSLRAMARRLWLCSHLGMAVLGVTAALRTRGAMAAVCALHICYKCIQNHSPSPIYRCSCRCLPGRCM